MSAPTVTFETKCYEKDWEILLKTSRLESMIARNCYDFQERILYINNVADPDKVKGYAERLKSRGVISGYVHVDEYAAEALAFFGIDRDSFKGGYYYSIQELVGIYRCRTDYLLHFSSDSILEGRFSWIPQALEQMEGNGQIKAACCVWNRKFGEAQRDAVQQTEQFCFVEGFTDQCYLVRTADFRKPIYNETHPDSQHFPHYGGELFEKRVDAWMRANGYLRCVYRHGSYLSKNYPRNRLLRTASRLLGMYDR